MNSDDKIRELTEEAAGLRREVTEANLKLLVLVGGQAIKDAQAAGVPTRTYPREEITRDPIFLLQKRHWYLADQSEWRYCTDAEAYVSDLDDDLEREDSWEEWKDDDDSYDYWETVEVYLTRKEAEDFGEASAHRYKDGWQVYCIPCGGELAKLLKLVSVTPEEEDSDA